MNKSFDEARLAVQKAREALRNNDRSTARQLAEQAAALAPQMEDPWLILAAVAGPRAGMDYVQKALKLDPNSPRAQRAMQWALQHLNDPQSDPPAAAPSGQQIPVTGLPNGLPRATGPVPSAAPQKPARRAWLPFLLLGLGVLVCAAAAWSATTSPVVAAILRKPAIEPTHPVSWAQVSLPKPTYTPAAPSNQMADMQATATPQTMDMQATPEFLPTDPSTALSTDLSTDLPTAAPTDQPTEMAAEPPTAVPTWSGSLSMEYVQDTPTSPVAAPAPTKAGSLPPVPGDMSGSGQHWIDVNLTQQMVYAYAGDTVENSFLVSTGTWQYPTVTGQYHVYVKLRYTDMSGPDYYLPNVPFTMYFYQGYGLHGTYWHHNFGTPMSYGCVNLSTPDAEWLYNFSSVGTLVNIHY